jgi:uncharacterized protein YegL
MVTVPVILRNDPVSRLDFGNRRTRTPNVAVVYAAADGTIYILDGGKPQSFSDQLSGLYKRRYEVDLSDHQHTVELRTCPPPARGGIYTFRTMVTVGFRVVDPGQVVRRNVTDALRLVCDYLMWAFRDITIHYPIEEAKAAEDEINARFRNGLTLDGGVQLYLCQARLSPDAAALAYLQAEERANRSNIVKAAEHLVNAEDARRENELGLIRQHGSLTRRERERAAMAGRALTPDELLAMHLESNPGDTANMLRTAMELQQQRLQAYQTDQALHWQQFTDLADRDLVQPVDIEDRRAQALARLQQPAAPIAGNPVSGPARNAADAWDAPLPNREVPGLIPVYVVIDESSAVAAGLDALTAGLRALFDGVAGRPDIAEVVRLAVVGYADDAAVHLAMQAVRGGVHPPAFTGTGRPRLSSAFERLMDCIPRDAEALKAQTASLRRPQVLLLSGGRPADDPQWRDVHRTLVDRTSQRYAPDVIACGIGGATPQTMLSIATRPELAYVSPGGDLSGDIGRFCAFAQRRVLEYGRAVLDGDQNSTVVGPDGFRLAGTLVQGD